MRRRTCVNTADASKRNNDGIETGICGWSRDKGPLRWPSVGERPVCGPGGARCIGGVSSSQALAWNRRTCRPDRDGRRSWPREGEPQAANTASGRVPMRGTGADRLPNLVPIPGITGSAHCAVRPLEGSDSRAVRGSVGQGSPRSVFRKADPESFDRHAGLCVPGPCSRSRRRLRRYAGRRRRRLHATHGTQDRERRTCSARHDRVSATHRLPGCSASCLVSGHDRIFGHPQGR